jgi:hypothetical protein
LLLLLVVYTALLHSEGAPHQASNPATQTTT